MKITKQEAKRNMRRCLYDAMRHNQIFRCTRIARHEIVEVLVGIMTDQIELIREDAAEHRID